MPKQRAARPSAPEATALLVRVREIYATLGIATLDLGPILRPELCFPNDLHRTATAHARVTTAAADEWIPNRQIRNEDVAGGASPSRSPRREPRANGDGTTEAVSTTGRGWRGHSAPW